MTEYRFSPAVTARLLGLTMIVMAVVAAVATLGISLADWPGWTLVVPSALVVVLVIALMAWSSTWIVRLSDEGYQVRRIRSAGVMAGRWKEVEDAVATERMGTPCVVLRLKDGRTTTFPVDAIHVNNEEFANTISEYLNRGHGIRPLTS